MCCTGFTCGLVTFGVGVVLAVTVTVVTFAAVPGLVESIIESQMTLIDDTIQMDRFEEVPVPLNFTLRFWNISNPDVVLQGGVPVVTEVGPYIYQVYISRDFESVDPETITYRILQRYEYDAEASYPNKEDDIVTVANAPYNAILQVAESLYPLLMPALSIALDGIFGVHNSPIMQVRVRDIAFDGVELCQGGGSGLVASIACSQVRDIGQDADNLEVQPDGSMLFALLLARLKPSLRYVVNRGLTDSADLGRLITFNEQTLLSNWPQDQCNMLNGTDSQIFPPFVDREVSIFALNTDICRSVEMRYQYDLEYEGIPVVRYAANEWFLANDEGCFCLNATRGINRPDGCLLQGAQELFSCVGAFLVLSYPHFLFADNQYANGLIGMSAELERHRIFIDLEPKTGTIVRGAKRGQFNIFLRPIAGIPATQNLRTTLTPIFWVEEGMSLPEEFVDEITGRLLTPLRIVDIVLPVLIAVFALVALVGVGIAVRARMRAAPSMHSDVTTKAT